MVLSVAPGRDYTGENGDNILEKERKQRSR